MPPPFGKQSSQPPDVQVVIEPNQAACNRFTNRNSREPSKESYLSLESCLFLVQGLKPLFRALDKLVYLRLNLICEIGLVSPDGTLVDEQKHLVTIRTQTDVDSSSDAAYSLTLQNFLHPRKITSSISKQLLCFVCLYIVSSLGEETPAKYD